MTSARGVPKYLGGGNPHELVEWWFELTRYSVQSRLKWMEGLNLGMPTEEQSDHMMGLAK